MPKQTRHNRDPGFKAKAAPEALRSVRNHRTCPNMCCVGRDFRVCSWHAQTVRRDTPSRDLSPGVPPMADGLDTLTYVSLFAGSSVVAALATQGLTIWREWSARRRAGKLAALRLSLLLERFAEDCLTRLNEAKDLERGDATYEDKDPTNNPLLNWVAPPNYPADLDWVALGTEDTVKAHEFRIAADHTKHTVMADYLYGSRDPDPAIDDAWKHLPDLGLRALALARRLRQSRGIFLEATDHRRWTETELKQYRDAPKTR